MNRQRVSLIIVEMNAFSWIFNADKALFFLFWLCSISWLPSYSRVKHWMANFQTWNIFFSLSMRLFFCLFQMYRIVTCLYISGNFEKSSALIGLNIWKKSQLHCKCEHTKNAITFINKSNACCGYFVMRLSLHGIALMCLSCFRSILVIGCTFDRAVRV